MSNTLESNVFLFLIKEENLQITVLWSSLFKKIRMCFQKYSFLYFCCYLHLSNLANFLLHFPSALFFFFFFLMVLGFEIRTSCLQGALPLEHLHQTFFCDEFFQDRVFRIVCTGWLQTPILLISAS
jgi:hypothetical protein